MRESSHRCNVLLSKVVLSRCVVLSSVTFGLSDSIDSLVGFSPVMVTHLSCSGDSPLDIGWMPRSDAPNFSKSTMGLSGKSLHTETSDDSVESFTLSSTHNVEAFSFFEDLINLDVLFEQRKPEVDFFFNGSSVDLDLEDVSLLLL